jgi:hypothetical protein
VRTCPRPWPTAIPTKFALRIAELAFSEAHDTGATEALRMPPTNTHSADRSRPLSQRYERTKRRAMCYSTISLPRGRRRTKNIRLPMVFREQQIKPLEGCIPLCACRPVLETHPSGLRMSSSKSRTAALGLLSCASNPVEVRLGTSDAGSGFGIAVSAVLRGTNANFHPPMAFTRLNFSIVIHTR